MSYTVYIHISPSGKRYVGVTSQSVERRWQKNGAGYRNQKLFWRAICKYGWDSFSHIVVKTGLEEKTAFQLERALIAKYKTQNPQFGYNMTEGGEGHTGYSPVSSTRELLSQATKKSWEDKNIAESRIRTRYKPIVQYTVEGKFVAEYSSLKEAKEVFGPGDFGACANGRYYTCKGFVWRWKGDKFSPPPSKRPPISEITRKKISAASKRMWKRRRL